MKIHGSVALVTGANRGVGLAFTRALLRAGAHKVYAGARDPDLVAVDGAHPFRLDVTQPHEVDVAARACPDVTLLINNAAIGHPAAFLSEHAPATARAQFETNFFGTLSMCRAFAPLLKSHRGGAIVNMLSVLSWLNLPALATYGASKAAAWALTNGIRNELRAQGTLVVGVHAAFIDTDMARRAQGPRQPSGLSASALRPEEVVLQALAAVEEGVEEVLADPLTRRAKHGLSLQQAGYLNDEFHGLAGAGA